MEGKIDVRIMQGGKLLKELSEENVIILTERQCGELFSHIGIEEAAILAAQISIEYDRLLKWINDKFHLDSETVGDLVKWSKIRIGLARMKEEIVIPQDKGTEQ